jgi:hypothetical protein
VLSRIKNFEHKIQEQNSENIEHNPRLSAQVSNHRKELLNKIKLNIANEKPTAPVDVKSGERPSVHELIKLNEERIRSGSAANNGSRNTVHRMYNTSRNEIRDKIKQILEENDRDTNFLDLEKDGFMKEKLRSLGIHEKDFKGLVDFYNKQASSSKVGKNVVVKQRNTVHTFQKNNRISAIKEEDDEKSGNVSKDYPHEEVQQELVDQISSYREEDAKTDSLNKKYQKSPENSKSDENYIYYNDNRNFRRKERNSNNGVRESNDIDRVSKGSGIGEEGSIRSSKQVYEYSNNSSTGSNQANKAKSAARAILKEMNSNEIESGDVTLISKTTNVRSQSPTVILSSGNNQSISQHGNSEVTKFSHEELLSYEKSKGTQTVLDTKNNINNHLEIKTDIDLKPIISQLTNSREQRLSKTKKSINKGAETNNRKSNQASNNPFSNSNNTNQLNPIEMSNQDHNKYQKNIIQSLDSIAVMQYNINPKLPLNPLFFDILCINCYECVRPSDVDRHSNYCIIQPDDYRDMNIRNDCEEDYNARIYKLHESLKKKKLEIYSEKNKELELVYNDLLTQIYEILMNNNVRLLYNFSLLKSWKNQSQRSMI